MALNRTTFSADATTKLAVCHKPRAADFYEATLMIYGNFGGGAVTILASSDGGTTKIPQNDYTGTAYTTSANATVNIRIPGAGGGNSDSIILYGTLTGSTSPALTIDVVDNLG